MTRHLGGAFSLLSFAPPGCASTESPRALAERVAQGTAARAWRHEVDVDSIRLRANTTIVWVSPRNWMATDAPQAGVRVAPGGRVVAVQWVLGG